MTRRTQNNLIVAALFAVCVVAGISCATFGSGPVIEDAAYIHQLEQDRDQWRARALKAERQLRDRRRLHLYDLRDQMDAILSPSDLGAGWREEA